MYHRDSLVNPALKWRGNLVLVRCKAETYVPPTWHPGAGSLFPLAKRLGNCGSREQGHLWHGTAAATQSMGAGTDTLLKPTGDESEKNMLSCHGRQAALDISQMV